MNIEKETLDKTEKFLLEQGLNIFQFIELIGKYNSKLLQFDDKNADEFSTLYSKIRDGKCNRKEKGKLLEELTSIIFHKGYSKLLECRRNCRTSTNEIDLQLNWTEAARMSGVNNAFPCFGESFLCECKNYSGKVNVTYV